MTRLLCVLFAALLLSSCSSSQDLREDFGISVQLWSVRDQTKKDFEGTLKKLSDMGMDGVEFAGYFHYTNKPKELKKLLQSLNLKAAAAHVKTKDLLPENIEKTIAFHEAIDCNYLIIPIDKRIFTNKKTADEAIAIFNQATKTLKKHGMKTGYHNHKQEFESGPNKDTTWWDYLAQNTDKEFILQQDVGWTWKAGKDAIAYVNKYKNRTITAHFRPGITDTTKGYNPFVGEDGQDWKTLINACLTDGGTEWFSIEQTDYPGGITSIQAVERSFNNLNKILKEMNLK